jgi:hypothetical protein
MGEERYRFVASNEACGTCLGLDGTESVEPIGLPHENCNCQVIKVGNCTAEYDYELSTTHRYGSPSGQGDYTIGAEIWVTCSDGTVIGESIELDGHGLPDEYGDSDDLWGAVDAALEAAASELASGCACEEDEFLCC